MQHSYSTSQSGEYDIPGSSNYNQYYNADIRSSATDDVLQGTNTFDGQRHYAAHTESSAHSHYLGNVQAEKLHSGQNSTSMYTHNSRDVPSYLSGATMTFSPGNKYNDPAEREKLIEKLLAEHGQPSGVTSNHANSHTNNNNNNNMHAVDSDAILEYNPNDETPVVSTNVSMRSPKHDIGGQSDNNNDNVSVLSRNSHMSTNSGEPHSAHKHADAERRALEQPGNSPTNSTYQTDDGSVEEDTAPGSASKSKSNDNNANDDTLFFASDLNESSVSASFQGMSSSFAQHAEGSDHVITGSYQYDPFQYNDDLAHSLGHTQEYDPNADFGMSLATTLPANHSQESPAMKQGGGDIQRAAEHQQKAQAWMVPLGEEASVTGRGEYGETYQQRRLQASPLPNASTNVHITSTSDVATDNKENSGLTNIDGTVEQGSQPETVTHSHQHQHQAHASAQTGKTTTSKSQPPSRLNRPPKEWKYIKSRAECDEEGKHIKPETYTFKPELATRKYRRSTGKKSGKQPTTTPASSSRLNENGLANNTTSGDMPTYNGGLEHKYTHYSTRPPAAPKPQHKAKIPREVITSHIDQQVAARERSIKAREDLKRQVEAMEAKACTFKPRITKMAQQLSAQQRDIEQNRDLYEPLGNMYGLPHPTARPLHPSQVGNVDNENPLEFVVQDGQGNYIYNKEAGDEVNYTSSRASVMATSERLYKEGATRQEQQKWLNSKIEMAKAVQYPFSPQLLPSSQQKIEELSNKYGDTHVPIHERIGEMQKFKTKRLQDLSAAVEENQRKVLTFAPKIDPKSAEMAARKRQADDRLESMQTHGNDNAMLLAQSTAMNPSDNVNIGYDVTTKELAHPLNKFNRAIQSALVDSDNNDASRPANNELINSTATRIAEFDKGGHPTVVDRKSIDVATRLTNEGKLMHRKATHRIMQRDMEQAKAHAQKGVSKGTAKIAQGSEFVGATFAQRQQMYKDKIHNKQKERLKEAERASQDWFNPSIGKSDDIIAATHPEMVVETPEERAQRLYKRDAEVKDYHIKQMERAVYSDVTFAPKIGPVSSALGTKSSLEELVHNPRGKAVRDAVRRRVEEEQKAACPFKPRVREYMPEGYADFTMDEQDMSMSMMSTYNQARYDKLRDQSANIYEDDLPSDQQHSGVYPYEQDKGLSQTNKMNQSHASIVPGVAHKQQINMQEPERMARDIRMHQMMKEEHRRRELVSKELDELKECTFTPQVIPYHPPNQERNPVVIKGLDRHLELQIMTLRKKEEAEEREREVFHVANAEKLRRPEDGTTVIQPFELSEGDTRMSRAVDDMLRREEREFTFEPMTEQSFNRNNYRATQRFIG